MLPTNRQNNPAQPAYLRPGVGFVIIIFGALLAFEVFNYSTTDLALGDLLGDLTFMGIRWSTILALAFCGIDFAGIARLFTPEQGMNEPKEVWYLFVAWLLAATMNAILTWWGVSMAVVSHQLQSSAVVDPQTITGVVPIFVAVMVWVIRILIIGTLSLAMDRLVHPGTVYDGTAQAQLQGLTQRPMEERGNNYAQAAAQKATQGGQVNRIPSGFGNAGSTPRSVAAKGTTRSGEAGENQPAVRPRVEPGYHSLSGGKGKGRRS